MALILILLGSSQVRTIKRLPAVSTHKYTVNGKDFGKCITVQRTDIFIEKPDLKNVFRSSGA